MSVLDDLQQERKALREEVQLLKETIGRLESKCLDLLAMLQTSRESPERSGDRRKAPRSPADHPDQSR